MSSSRSIAGARQRRAGEPVSVVQQQQQQPGGRQSKQQIPSSQQHQVQQSSGAPPGKLSISDAFALVTLRLGRVENMLQKMDVSEPGAAAVASESRSSDDVVIRSIISRIEDLEKAVKVPNKALDVKTNLINDKMVQMSNEIRDSRDTIFKLQSLILDLNQKMMNLMMPVVKDSIPVPTQAIVPVQEEEEELGQITVEDVIDEDESEEPAEKDDHVIC